MEYPCTLSPSRAGAIASTYTQPENVDSMPSDEAHGNCYSKFKSAAVMLIQLPESRTLVACYSSSTLSTT